MSRTVAIGVQDYAKIIKEDYFFSNKHPDRGDLFEGLSIWEDEK